VPFIIGTHRGPTHDQPSSANDFVNASFTFWTAKSTLFDAVLIPGGQRGITTLSDIGEAVGFVNEAIKHCKPIGALSSGVEFLSHVCVLPPNARVSRDYDIVSSEGIVTVAGIRPNNTSNFCMEFANAIASHRFWLRDVAKVPV